MSDDNHDHEDEKPAKDSSADADSRPLAPPTSNSTYNDFAGLGNWEPRVLIDGITFPEEGIEISSVAATYTIQSFTRASEHASSIYVSLRSTSFETTRHMFFNREDESLKVYVTQLLGIRPFLLRELYNFLGVYVNIKSFERDDSRKKSILCSWPLPNGNFGGFV
ncbi:hypothetical protein GQ600_14267 [Phytophthora cactorum]|nr:hypothetical protein GQ600_14267 [Phytophthora cactorum]